MEEIRHAFEILGLAGVNMQCFCGARSAADPLFEPIYAELDRRGAVLFLHPCINGLCSRFVTDWRLEAAAGPPLEDTLIAIHYMATAIPSRYSNLKIVIPHLGGSLAVLLERLDNQLPAAIHLAEPPSRTARRMWYDCCCHGSMPALAAAVAAFGASRLLVGSDYPFLSSHEPYARTVGFLGEAGLGARDGARTLTENAREMLPPR